MKKLMFVAAAVAAGVAVADVTSANVVGYTKDMLPGSNKYKPVCSQFLKIGSTDGQEMTLAELTPNIADSGSTHWVKADTIKVVSTGGAVDFTAKYYRWSDLTTTQKRELFGDDEASFREGWYKCENKTGFPITAECVNTYPLAFGTAVMALSSKSAATIQSNGEVYESETGFVVLALPGSNKYRFIGNCTPNDLTLADFEPNIADSGTTHWVKADSIKIISTGGAIDYTAKYYRWSDLTTTQKRELFSDDEANFTTGWYKCENKTGFPITSECVNAYEVPAGSGFLAISSKSAATIKFPSAL